eukprot:TRINITY_DN7806_c0_g1_i1.p1 TRINITY_DN7806_c0_g1~~TRINITY_DN7806_c0_g1_i1.p1  ORF type:complete len:915 (-),score=234.25 TRINITY_DN7806_c0_g1_i1:369-3113(-)
MACPSAVPPLNLTVNLLNGEDVARVEAAPEQTVEQVAEAALAQSGLEGQLKLVDASGRLLDSSTTVADAGLRDSDAVTAVVRRRERQINRIVEIYERAERLNACFVVDCTGSMSGHIRAVKDQIRGIVQEMQRQLPTLQLRLSFVGYRDHGDEVRFELLPFTTCVEEFEAFVAEIRARGGGGDGPEDVHGAIQQASQLDWTAGDAATRVLIHIADHGAHGRQWNDSPRDRYPDGDPYGLDLVGLLEQLRSLDVQYVFGHITSHTEKMVRVLNEILGGYVDTKDMAQVASVAEAVTASLHSSVASTVNTLAAQDKPKRLTAEEMSDEIPDWTGVPAVRWSWRSCLPVDDVTHLLAEANPSATRKLQETAVPVQEAPMPFSQGETRLARHALCEGQAMVLKEMKQAVSGQDDEEDAADAEEEQLDVHVTLSEISAIARFLASLFSATRPHGDKVEFLPSAAVFDAASGRHGNLEQALPAAEFQRFSNNMGWWEADVPETLLHFSRFTHQVTQGHMMVVDLQGVRTDAGWLLTDPCLLCDDTSRFGSGNLGPHAMARCSTTLARRLDGPVTTPEAMIPVAAPRNAWVGLAADYYAQDAPLDLDGILRSLTQQTCRPVSEKLTAGGLARLVASGAQRVVGRGCSTPEKLAEGQIRALLRAAKDVFLRQSSLLELQAPLKVLGDTHGQFHNTLQFFEMGGTPGDVNSYLLLGDYVDRGKMSVQNMCFLLANKVKHPENVFLLRGNHECASINRVYGFYDECKRNYNIKLWKNFTDVFNCLPLTALVDDKILCMHGGLSPELQTFEQLRRIPRPSDVPDMGLVCDLLWSDPDKDETGWQENDRGISYTFGADVVEQQTMRLGLNLVVRAHQVVEDGYEFFADRRLVTLFSAPKYCGEFDNAGAMLVVDKDLLCNFRVLRS